MNASPPAIYDLAVIGGGINGAGIARDAAGRGLKVLLVEKDDLASHTSSWSTKLIHGGLRYLEHYEFRLVAEALSEREVLLQDRAAHHRAAAIRAAARAAPAAGMDDPLRPVSVRSHRRPQDAAVVVRRRPRREQVGRRTQGQLPQGLRLLGCAGRRCEAGGLQRDRGARTGRRYPRPDAARRPRGARTACGARRWSTRAGRVARTCSRARWSMPPGPGSRSCSTRSARTRFAPMSGTSRAATSSCRACTPSRTLTSCRIPTSASSSSSRYEQGFSLIGTTDVPVDDYDAPRISADEIDYLCSIANAYLARPLGRGRHRLDLQRRASALRRWLGGPVGDHARLRAQARCRGRPGPAAVDLRRQDHDLPQARRACARPSCARSFRRCGQSWTRSPAAARRRPAARRARGVRARARRALRRRCRRTCWRRWLAATARARRASWALRATPADLGSAFRAYAVRRRNRLAGRAGVGDRGRRRAVAANQMRPAPRAAHERDAVGGYLRSRGGPA